MSVKDNVVYVLKMNGFFFIFMAMSLKLKLLFYPHIRSLFLIHYLFKRSEGQSTVLCDLWSLQGAQGMLGTSCEHDQSYSLSSSSGLL